MLKYKYIILTFVFSYTLKTSFSQNKIGNIDSLITECVNDYNFYHNSNFGIEGFNSIHIFAYDNDTIFLSIKKQYDFYADFYLLDFSHFININNEIIPVSITDKKILHLFPILLIDKRVKKMFLKQNKHLSCSVGVCNYKIYQIFNNNIKSFLQKDYFENKEKFYMDFVIPLREE